ncbi:hypothetical protein CDD83_2063 [Cordyceps sp. RAO-2017]|nr:hypothetical protein CDD83_2063 [Cordyceps sp. RAO-2017]
MADFRQLALDFILEDDESRLSTIAKNAASELEAAPASTNPVARWVESVQPWMPGSNDDDMMDIGRETPDWSARAKALEFLSRSLDYLNPNILKPSQVKLLVAFFGAMFDVDHKAGVVASATALSRIVAMKSFQPHSGRDIINKLCALADDFPRQTAKTRLAIYELLRSLVTDAAVAGDLQRHEGVTAGFMGNLLRLCQNERDPDCLMVWFDLLRFFLAEYPSSEEILEGVYGAFKAYFPITLPRTSQSSVTPEALKLQLRRCFASNHRLAPLALPFLIGKLDQGDGVTVNVKLDILRTIRACVEEYSDPEQSIAPYADSIWTSLKFEVRNGEVEDTIWATLEALKAIATRLEADGLRNFTLTVTRECVADLSNPTYTASAGRLLISVMSANARAFVLMVSAAVNHIKENLRHPRSPMHSQDLLKILRIILETRLLLTDLQLADQDRADFAAADVVFKTLYEDVYRNPLQAGSPPDARDDDVKLSAEAAQGAGALVCQRAAKPSVAGEPGLGPELLLPEGSRAEIGDALFSIAARSWDGQPRMAGSDELINDAVGALRRTVDVDPAAFKPLMERGLATIRESYAREVPEAAATIQRLSSVLSFVGCSGLRPSPTCGMRAFLSLSCALTSELLTVMDGGAHPSIWCSLVAGIQSAAHYFKDACHDASVEEPAQERTGHGNQSVSQSSWVATVTSKYPALKSVEGAGAPAASPGSDSEVPELVSIAELRDDFLLIGLFLCRQLYRRATRPLERDAQTGSRALALSEDFTGVDRHAEYRFLSMLSDLAAFVVGEMNRSGSFSLPFDVFFLTLFRDDFIPIPDTPNAADRDSWRWLALGPLNMLPFGILRSMLPSSVMRLFGMGVAQQMLVDGTSSASGHDDATGLPVTRAVLAVLANKYQVETLGELMTTIEQHLGSALEQAATGSSPEDRRRGMEQSLTIFTVASGLLRRCTGKQTRGLVQLLLRAPDDAAAGHALGGGLELITAPLPFVTDSIGSVQRPLWMQKVYVDLVKPMIDIAAESTPAARSPLARTNYGTAALRMVQHIRFAIYEDDAGPIVRIAITTAQTLGPGPDTQAALEVVRTILVEAPDAVQDHLRSLTGICTGLVTRGPLPPRSRPDWLPDGYGDGGDDDGARTRCGRLALEIVGGLPRIFEPQHLLAYAPPMRRALAFACGHRARDLRRIARLARAAWAELT